MDVLNTKTISEKDAAKMLKKFVDAKQEEENTDLMMNEEVKFQLVQVLEHLEGKKQAPVVEEPVEQEEDEDEEDDE